MTEKNKSAEEYLNGFENIIYYSTMLVYAEKKTGYGFEEDKRQLRKSNDYFCRKCYESLQENCGLSADEAREAVVASIKSVSGRTFVEGWTRALVSENALDDKSLGK